MITKRDRHAVLWCLIIASLAPSAACSSGGARTPSADAPIDAGDDGAPTYHAIYTEILSQTCFLGFCHSSQESDYLLLDTEADGYRSLVGPQAQGPMCSATGLERVAPGRPDESLILFKLTNAPCGALDGESPCPADAGPATQARNSAKG